MNVESIVPIIKKASAWVIIWGIVTFVCGILAIILPLTFSFGIALVIGCLVLVAAIAPTYVDGKLGLKGFLGENNEFDQRASHCEINVWKGSHRSARFTEMGNLLHSG